MQRIVELSNENYHKKCITAQYSRYDRDHPPKSRECVGRESTRAEAMQLIKNSLLAKVEDWLSIHVRNRCKWAIQWTRTMGVEWLQLSSHWLGNFKKKNGIGSRKVTKYETRAQIMKNLQIRASILQIEEIHCRQSRFFKRRAIGNMDQTGFAREYSNLRTLSFDGERDTVLNIAIYL